MSEGAQRPPFPHIFQTGELILKRYRINSFMCHNAGANRYVYDAVAVCDDPSLGLHQGDRVVIKVVSPADAAAAQNEYDILRGTITNWWDASVAEPVEVNGTYIVTRFVEGRSLRDILDESGGCLPAARAIKLAHSTLRALDVLHRPREEALRGLVHRDIKPENIMVKNPKTPEERVVLIDFGISSTVTEAAGGPLVATWPYASPEQRLDPEKISARSDIFATGVVLYEMLSGHRPFGNGIHEFPRDEDVRLLGISCPDGSQRQIDTINDILKRALMMDPSRRYSEALDMSRELELVGSTDFRVILRPDGPLLNLGSYPAPVPPVPVPPVPITPPNYGDGSGTEVDPQSHGRSGSGTQLNPPHYQPQHNDTTPFHRDPVSNSIFPPPPVYDPSPLDDKYIELINRAIAHRNPHDWGSLVESAAMRHARKTAQEVYQSYPICRFLRLLRRRAWLEARIVRAIDSAGQFVLTSDEVNGLTNDQNALLAREHIARYDAEVRRQAQGDASGTSRHTMFLLSFTGIVILLICIFGSLL